MFAKFWSPGDVKTRLAASLGPARAAAIHRLFVETLVARMGKIADRRTIAFSPAETRAAFRDLAGDRWQLTTQSEGDLGCRMRSFFEQSLPSSSGVVVIGSDSPDLPIDFIDRAFAALESHDVVLGPAQDGGYYLVGAARTLPPIFDEVAWGTNQVWSQTMSHLRAASCRWTAVPAWFDVDDKDDLRALLGRLKSFRQRDTYFARLDSQLQGLLSDCGAV